jgi:superfamily II DNA or RNA helicase
MGFYSLDLDEIRSREQERIRKTPFEHQLDAFTALNRTFTFADGPGKGGLLVLPTGAGKTFTTVKWLSDQVLKRNAKIIWLAHSFYLLDQAFKEFHDYARWIPEPRQILNIRLVSSNPSHDSPSSIQLTDDVVIMTTQTAIKNLHVSAVDPNGRRVISNFRRFVENGEQTGLFVVLDEAHHAPAYGCRNLLVNRDDSAPGIRRLAPSANLLGLTATPTYTDETRRGWLGKIFDAGILYQAEKARLTAQGILARPNYIPNSTGRELVVSDDLYNRLVREHQDLPEDIIESLAMDSRRNDYIVQHYLQNKERYGKTIIFADRWFQCVYLKDKLVEKGVRADAVYSHIDADPGSADARNKRTTSDNERILNEFRHGKDSSGRDKLDVLINVRMLTEGTDVPTVRTVFLTRQTTSAILMAQMIGRALRGRKAGGGDEANIVLFMDEWKRLIDWATPASLDGGTEVEKVIRGYYPLEYISIRLVEELCRQINSGGEILSPRFSEIVPVGWFQTELVVAAEDGSEETQSFTEFVMVYEHTKPKFQAFMEHIQSQMPEGWDKESLSSEWIRAQTQSWVSSFFDPDTDLMGSGLDMNLASIARHIAQRQSLPHFHSFEERDKHDLDSLARSRLNNNSLENDEFLRCEFNKSGCLWKVFYKSYERFAAAFDGATRRALYEKRHGRTLTPTTVARTEGRTVREFPDAVKAHVKRRDHNTCLCCGATGKGIKLQVDHIVSYNLGGDSIVENAQTLCSVCNREKKTNELNFLNQTASQLLGPHEPEFLPRSGREDVKYSITRLVNYFYRCRAVSEVRIHKRSSGQFYARWEIELFPGNDPAWLRQHKGALLAHIQNDFGCPHVTSLKILGTK